MMMGIEGRPRATTARRWSRWRNYGVQVMSIGFLVDADNPMIWRGPMATQALEQLLRQTNWSELDYLIVDMPPGTGDIQLTLSQRVPLTGAVIVTTPQDIALLDAKRASRCSRRSACRSWAGREHGRARVLELRPCRAHLRRRRRQEMADEYGDRLPRRAAAEPVDPRAGRRGRPTSSATRRRDRRDLQGVARQWR
jgi:hypothetical protein